MVAVVAADILLEISMSMLKPKVRLWHQRWWFLEQCNYFFFQVNLLQIFKIGLKFWAVRFNFRKGEERRSQPSVLLGLSRQEASSQWTKPWARPTTSPQPAKRTVWVLCVSNGKLTKQLRAASKGITWASMWISVRKRQRAPNFSRRSEIPFYWLFLLFFLLFISPILLTEKI